ncbi:MAG: type IV pilus assembly protein PilM [bacterium]
MKVALFGIGASGAKARIGVDIGTRYVKVAQLNPTSQGIQLQSYGISATPQGAVTDGILNNPEAVGEALQQIVKYFGIKERKAVCALPGRLVTIRTVNLPAGLSDREVKVATIGEVERFLQFPLDEMEYDYQVLGTQETGDRKQVSVLFVASHKDSVQKRVESLRHGGLDSVEVDVEPFVLMRSVVEAGLFNEQETFQQTIMLMEMGASSTGLSIIAGGSLRFTRIFAIGGDTFTHAIESGFDMSFLDAEKLKKEKAVAVVDEGAGVDGESREIHELIRSHLENLAMEVRRSIAYYTSKYRGEAVNRIILTGGGSLMKGIRKFFEDEIGIPVGYANPLANVVYVGDREVEELSPKVPYMGVAVGLSLRQMPPRVLGRFTMPVAVELGYEFGSAAHSAGVS